MSHESELAMCQWCGIRRYVNRAREHGPCRSCVGIKEPVGPTDWMKRAACVGVDSDIFFDSARIRERDYIPYCRSCDVSHECAAYAFANKEAHGVWGGLTPEQRSHQHLRTTTTGGTT